MSLHQVALTQTIKKKKKKNLNQSFFKQSVSSQDHWEYIQEWESLVKEFLFGSIDKTGSFFPFHNIITFNFYA